MIPTRPIFVLICSDGAADREILRRERELIKSLENKSIKARLHNYTTGDGIFEEEECEKISDGYNRVPYSHGEPRTTFCR